MGTRGWFAFLYNGVYYRIYNKYDSYFSGLGSALTKELQAGNLEERLTAWRRLLHLARVVENARLEAPTESSAAQEWKETQAALSKYSSGPLGDWFMGEMELTDHAGINEKLVGDGLFIEFIYLVDLDSNKFFAHQHSSTGQIFHSPLSSIPENWVELADNEKQRNKLPWTQSFPLPKSILEPLMDDIASNGYLVHTERSLSNNAGVYQARRTDSDTEVFIKVFFTCYSESLWWDQSITAVHTYSKPMAVADLLLAHPHPNLVPIIAKTKFSGNPSLVLEAFDCTLQDELVRAYSAATSFDDFKIVCNALSQVAQGLVYLHKHGIVHHDIKPANILCRYATASRGGGKSVRAAICDFESIGVPGFEASDKRWKDLDWGPFKMRKASPKDDDKNPEGGPMHKKTKEETCRWCEDWDPDKHTLLFAHPQKDTVSPWALDCHALGRTLEFFLAVFRKLISDKKPFVDVVELLKHSTHDYSSALTNLEKTSEVLKGV